jgi:hypothetical protein
MAQVVSRKQQFPIGPLRAVILEVSHQGVTSSVLTPADHGFTSIAAVFANQETGDTDILVQKNVNASGASLGSIYTTLVTSNDVVTYLIFGN